MKRYIIIYVMVWSGGLVQVRSSQAKERPATPVDQGDNSLFKASTRLLKLLVPGTGNSKKNPVPTLSQPVQSDTA